MHRWTDLAEIPSDFGSSAVAIGNFDGVHRGHQEVLIRLVADARTADLRSVVMTFEPHPRQLHQPDTAPPVITGLTDRLELLAATGLDAVLVQPYTWEFAQQSPEEFVKRYLVDGLRAAEVVVGHDIRFGWGNAGDLSTMLELGRRHGFAVRVIEDVRPGDHSDRRWSSTWVRERLASGDVAGAARILGRLHRIRGTVVRGDARGRDLGFPTANLAPDSAGMVPAEGVYAGWLTRTDGGPLRPEARLPAAISVGANPTFGGQGLRVEAYVLDRTDLDLYGAEVVVEFAERLRPIRRFDSVADLVRAMTDDVERTRTVLFG